MYGTYANSETGLYKLFRHYAECDHLFSNFSNIDNETQKAPKHPRKKALLKPIQNQ